MRKVLLATDGSEYSEEAAWFLSHLPHDGKLDLTVLTVVEMPSVSRGYPTSDWIQRSVNREKFLAEETFAEVEAMFEGADVRLHHMIREGNRGEMIVNVAKEMDADLVVLGSRGHSNVSRLLLGSTSDFVATHAPCSVLVVRPTGLRTAKRPLRIAVGYEAKDPADKAITEIGEIHWGAEVDLRVVTIVWLATDFFDDIDIDPEVEKKEVADAVRSAAARLQHVSPHVTPEMVENAHVGDGLVDYAQRHGSDLIVVGDTHRSVMGRFLVGSVSRFVLRHAPCSVWIARQPQRHDVPPRPHTHAGVRTHDQAAST